MTMFVLGVIVGTFAGIALMALAAAMARGTDE